MKKITKILLFTIPSVIAVAVMAVGAVHIYLTHIGDGYNISTYTNGYYSGKVQSYLDVYKDLWNASTPEDMHVEKAIGYDSPIEFDEYARTTYSYLHFIPIFSSGTIDDARVFTPVFNYIFQVDFAGAGFAPHPYYLDKKVNCVLGFGTVRYCDEAIGSLEYNNVMYLLMECDGRITQFSANAYRDYSGFYDSSINYDSPFDEVEEPSSYEYFTNGSLAARQVIRQSESDSNYFESYPISDGDGQIIGLNYGRPFDYQFKIGDLRGTNIQLGSYIYHSLSITFSRYATRVLSSPSVSPCFSIGMADNLERYISDKKVYIKSPRELILPYLTYYSVFRRKVARGIDKQLIQCDYAGKKWKTSLLPWSNSDRFGYYQAKIISSKDFKPPFNLKFGCISYGDTWRPLRFSPSGKFEFSNYKGGGLPQFVNNY